MEEPFGEEETKLKLYELGLSAVGYFTASALFNRFQKKCNRPVAFSDYGFNTPEDFVRSIPFIVEVPSPLGPRFKCILKPKPPVVQACAPALQPPKIEYLPPEETPSAVNPPSTPLLQVKVEPENDPGETPAIATAVGEEKEEVVADTIETDDASAVEVVEREQSSSDEEEITDDLEDIDEEGETEEVKRDEEETKKLGEERKRLPQVDARVKEVTNKPMKSVSYDETPNVFYYSEEDSDDDDLAESVANPTHRVERCSSELKGILMNPSGPLTRRIPIVIDELSSDEDEDPEEEENESEVDSDDEAALVAKQKKIKEEINETKERIRLLPCTASTERMRETAKLTNLIEKGRIVASTILRLHEEESDDEEKSDKPDLSDDDEPEKVDSGEEEESDADRSSGEEYSQPALVEEKEVEKVNGGKEEEVSMPKERSDPADISFPEEVAQPAVVRENEAEKVDSGETTLEKAKKEGVTECASDDDSREPNVVEEQNVEKMDSGNEEIPMLKEVSVDSASPEEVAQPAEVEENEADEVASGAEVAPMQQDRPVEDSSVEELSQSASSMEEEQQEAGVGTTDKEEQGSLMKESAVESASGDESSQPAVVEEHDAEKVDSPPPIVVTPPISSSSSACAIFTNEIQLEARTPTPAPKITGLPMTSASVAVPEQVPAEIVEAERLRQILKDVGGLLAVDELVKRSEVSRERVEELATTTDKFFIGLDEDGGKEYATIVGEQLSHVIEWLCGLLESRGAPLKFTTLKKEYAKKYDAPLKHDERKDLVGFSGDVNVFCDVLTKTGKLIHYGEGPAKRHLLARPGMHVVETPEAGGAKDITREVTPETPAEVTKKGKKKEAGGSGRKRTRNDEGEEETTEEGGTGGAKKKRCHRRRSSDAEELGDQDSEEKREDEKKRWKKIKEEVVTVKEEIVSPKAKKSLKRRHESDDEDVATNNAKAYGLVVSMLEMAEKSGADLNRLAKKISELISEELLRD